MRHSNEKKQPANQIMVKPNKSKLANQIAEANDV